MKRNLFFALAGSTALLAIGAVGSQWATPSIATAQAIEGHAFPELRDQLDKVSLIKINHANGSFSLAKSDGVWIAPEKYDYRADSQDVNELLVQLGNMQLASAKTSLPERFARLEVEDVGPESKSRSIRLEDEAGNVLVDTIIGKRAFKRIGEMREGTYIRKVGEDQSWLATGGIRINETLNEWLDFDLVKIARSDVKTIERLPAEGPSYSLTRTDADADFTLSGLTPGQSVKDDASFGTLTGALANLTIEDVKPVKELAFPMRAETVHFETFDGKKVTVRLAELDGLRWATFSEVASGEKSATSLGQTKEANAGLNAKSHGWAFQINETAFGWLTKPIDEWLEQESTS